MKYKFLLLGGDLRSVKLAEMLIEDNHKVLTYGLEENDEIINNEFIEKAPSLALGIEKSKIIIAPIPFSSDGEYINTPFSKEKVSINELVYNNKNKVLITGSINDEIKNELDDKYLKVIDLMKREELAILNTIATAEGTIEVAISNTDIILQGARVLILGFGRVAKTVANKFSMLSANVTCSARKISDLAWIKAYGYEAINLNDIVYELKNFDIIINTIPKKIISEKELKHMKSDVLLIDLASYPGGIDSKLAVKMGLNFKWPLALPGKIAPISSAKFIKDTIYNVLEEENEYIKS